jgi:lipid-binding SYLF domain-containing protein
MLRKITVGFSLLFFAVALYAANKEQERLENCGVVMQEIVNVPENIPQPLLDKAECIIVFPSVLKAAFVVGGSYGRGAMICRTGKDFRGSWGSPAMYALEGGSIGFQIGGEATDLVLLVMNDRGASSILDSKVKLGGDASVAAGPVGRDASADTDAYMRAEVLEGASLRPDNDASADVYGTPVTAREIIRGGKTNIPNSGRLLVSVLEKHSPRNDSARHAASN